MNRCPRTRAITVALLVLVGAERATAQETDKGKAVYATHCQSCHGADASGGPGPPLVGFAADLAEFTTLVRQGVGLMPPFPRSKIEDEEIAELHAYLTSLNQRQTAALSRWTRPLPEIDARWRHRVTSSRLVLGQNRRR